MLKKMSLKSATKPLNVLIAFTRPLITEFADNLNLKHPLLPTMSPYPTISSEAIDNEPILFKSLKERLVNFSVVIPYFLDKRTQRLLTALALKHEIPTSNDRQKTAAVILAARCMERK